MVLRRLDCNAEKKRLDIQIDLKSGRRFACAQCKAARPRALRRRVDVAATPFL